MPRAPYSPSPRSRRALAELRLANQRIAGSAASSPADAVRSMLALQGQDLPGARWSIGLRVPGSTDADVAAAFARGELVRSWPLRGTLHVTAAADLPWLLELFGARLIAGLATRHAALDLDDRTTGRAGELALRALSGGSSQTREELLAAFDAGGVSTAGQRGYHLLGSLSLAGTLCLGPIVGKEQRYVLLHEWVKSPRRLARDEALAELARRYFSSHGPATLADLAWWAKLGMKDAKAALALARPHLAELVTEGRNYLMAKDAEDVLASARARGAEPEGSVFALPGFDEYVLGYAERGDVLDAEHFERIVPGGNGMFMPTIVVSGQVRGTWKRTVRAKETRIEAVPFGRLSKAELAGFARAAAAYGAFTGAKITLSA